MTPKEKERAKAYIEAAQKSPALALSMALMQGMGQAPPKKAKRKPLLLDEVLANRHKGVPEDERRKIVAVQQRLRNAKVFKFDEDAAIYAAQMMRDYPEAIAHDVDFAIPPFQQMYIEYPFPKFYEILTPESVRIKDPLPLEDQDMDVGYFYDGPRVYVASRTSNKKDQQGMLLPLRFRLNQPFSFAEEVEVSKQLQGSRLTLDAFFWGSCYPKLIKANDMASMRALRERHSCEVWYGKHTLFEPKDLMTHLLYTNAGDLRSIVAFILFLNRTRDIQLQEEVPPAPGFVRAKPRTLTRYNLIRIKLDPAPLLKRIFKGRATGGWRREHDVRGHFVHDKTARLHGHNIMREDANYHAAQWTETNIHHWRCTVCGGRRWHRKAHHRGSSKAGQVLTTYEVEK